MEKSAAFFSFCSAAVLSVADGCGLRGCICVCSKGGNLMESFAVEGERRQGRETEQICQSVKLPCTSPEMK